MKFEVNIEKEYAYAILGLLILILGFFVVGAYGTSSPSTFGHSSGELQESDPTVLASVKDGISWNELSGIPVGFADGVDDTNSLHYIVNRHGNTGPCSTWCSTLGLICVTGHNAGTWGSDTVPCGNWAPVCVCRE